MTYWIDLYNGETWAAFVKSGAETAGFREERRKIVERLAPGDVLLCYLTGVSRFVGALEVTSTAFMDDANIWREGLYPARVRARPIVLLSPETGVPIRDLEALSIFRNLKNPHAWTTRVRSSPARWSKEDGEVVVRALTEAAANPIERPVDAKKLGRRPKALDTKIGPVTVPETDDDDEPTRPRDTSDHTVVQHQLLALGHEMGFSVWVARNDRSRSVEGRPLSDHFRLLDALPVQFDRVTTKIIEYIDVLWLKGNAIVAAFEVESTTSVYSGLLRMSDLIAMQPNLSVPLYIVAPDDRRDKVFVEVNRPTFARLSPPLVEMCRFISFSSLRQGIESARGIGLRYLRPEFLEELSEECTLEEA